jgi:hypothetical protein
VRYPKVLLDVDLSQCSFCELARSMVDFRTPAALG